MTVGSRLATRPGWRARMGPSGVARIERKRNPGMPLIRQALPGFRSPLHPGYKLEVKGPPRRYAPSAPRTRFGANGSSRRRTPVSAAMALPTGAGEDGVPVVACAVGNAIAAL